MSNALTPGRKATGIIILKELDLSWEATAYVGGFPVCNGLGFSPQEAVDIAQTGHNLSVEERQRVNLWRIHRINRRASGIPQNSRSLPSSD
jgi:hypothetical protein